MVTLRPSHERGHTQLSWLDSRHTFSFGDYSNPKHMGFRHLRVINEDRVKAGAGFGTHSHRDMEIITYVLEGSLAHKDSTGTSSVMRPGEVQRMSAGTGISHSEYNHSQTELVHFLQIWILPEQQNLKPNYEQRLFKTNEKHHRLRLIASREGRDGSVTVYQDVEVFIALLDPDDQLKYVLKPNRHAWVQVTQGSVILNGLSLKAGDGAGVSEEEQLQINANGTAEILLFDLA